MLAISHDETLQSAGHLHKMSNEFAITWIAEQVGVPLLEPQRRTGVPAPADFDPYWPALMAASVFGETIDKRGLALVLNLDLLQLDPILEELERSGTLRRASQSQRRGETSVLHFADPRLRAEVYATIVASRRRRLHRRAGEALEFLSVTPGHADAARIAGHYEVAGSTGPAFGWWRKAGEFAIDSASPKQAEQYLLRALGVSDADPSAIDTDGELSLLRLLGPVRAQLHGSGSDATSKVYSRCLEIADNSSAVGNPLSFDVLWGLSACILVHGRVETALDLCARLTLAAHANRSDPELLMAARLSALAHLLAGKVADALVQFRQVKQIYNSSRHAALRFRYASDQGAVSLAQQSWAEAIAGDLAASDRSGDTALAQIEHLEHPHTSAHVLCVLAACAQTLDRRTQAGPLAAAGLAVARQHEFKYWQAWADLILGWHDGARAPELAAARIDSAIQAYQSTGAGQALAYAQLLKATVAFSAGDRSLALGAAEAGLLHSGSHGVRLFDAELILIKAQATDVLAQRCRLIDAAIAVAREQGTRLFLDRALVLSKVYCCGSIKAAGAAM